MGSEDFFFVARSAAQAPRRTIESIDSELRSVAAVRRATREMGEPLPLTDVVDSLLDERLLAPRVGYNPQAFLQFPREKSA